MKIHGGFLKIIVCLPEVVLATIKSSLSQKRAHQIIDWDVRWK